MTRVSIEGWIVTAHASALLSALVSHFADHAEIAQFDGGAHFSSDYGTAIMRLGNPGLHIAIVAPSREAVTTIKAFLADHVFELAQDCPKITWSDTGEAGGAPVPPHHFQKWTIAAAHDVTPRMRRVIFECEDVSAYDTDDHYHVRLLIPRRQPTSKWPVVIGDGRIIWPSGEDELVRRVYTVRSVDRGAGRVTVDCDIHHDTQAPGSAFALNAKPGQVIGALGPGGGGLPITDHLILAGDETALPAISRILERLPATASGKAFLEVEDTNEVQCLRCPVGMELVWLSRDGATPGAKLQRAVRNAAINPRDGDLYVWVGCEFDAFGAIRAYVRDELLLPRQRHLIVPYWRRTSNGGL